MRKTREANMFFILISLAFLFIFSVWSIGTLFIMLYVAANMRPESKASRIRDIEHRIMNLKNNNEEV
jgi:hypothetical protein